MKATCADCGKMTWRGCGKHVEQVMKDVKEEDRCKCKDEEPAKAGQK